ncbi:nitroreductase family protein [Alicyclobacillus sp. ALC3]|uniref:nitroreductase family protein n=1 Tax=Alicyclobacillus sp. ALC3 TaxID=2796143 RepID=UPI002378E949|nr:nitroreductase [Alicyclobacillus sp. ALC3]WDL98317.1 nitroreductase [Alicyclobacillus sp. ALC3]
MDAFEAILTRRSTGAVAADRIPGDEDIDRILLAGTRAPNHHRTEPWRFFVLKGEGRRRLGAALGDIAIAGGQEVTSDVEREIRERAMAKAYRAPVIIAVAVVPSDSDRVEWVEEVAAGAAAAQNMLLAAHALGYGAIWRTGQQAYHARMKQLFELPETGQVVGFIYLGYPARAMESPAHRAPVAEKTVYWTTESD